MGQCVLFLAPPGLGKTHHTLNALKVSDKKAVFIAPLRALCEEVMAGARKRGLNVGSLCSSELANNKKLLVGTPEQYLSLKTSLKGRLVIFDECHLIYRWGDSFRSALLECWYDLVAQNSKLLLLSATMTERYLERLQNELRLNQYELVEYDLGNCTLQNRPRRVEYYPSSQKKVLLNRVYRERGCKLIFCQYRDEVKALSESLSNNGFKVISCVGGEAREFTERLKTRNDWEFIIATSVVGHGVNLPRISLVAFTYHVDSYDLYLQMVGRGGRDGSKFKCVGMNKELLTKWQKIRNYFVVAIELARLKVHEFIYGN